MSCPRPRRALPQTRPPQQLTGWRWSASYRSCRPACPFRMLRATANRLLPAHPSQGEVVCVWGECHLISERNRQKKLAEEMEERARNPPWYTRAWNTISGSGGTPTPASPAPEEVEAKVEEIQPPAQPASGFPEGEGAEFMASSRFAGARHGYVFKQGPKGVGYYRDL